MVSLFNDLNPKQKEAVETTSGPSVILAGAGSGKTRVLVSKVMNLILNHKVPSRSIMMITFTNKAASEMKSRIGTYPLGFIGTFHSFCVRVLRVAGEKAGLKDNFVIYDDSDQTSLIKKIIKEKNTGSRFSPSYFLNRISAAKNQLISPVKFFEVFSDYAAQETGAVYASYQKALKENNAVDFDDLLTMTVNLFKKDKATLERYQSQYRYVMVDEFQDTNFVQYELTRLLGQKYGNVTVVGDFSQSIYSWRGAEIGNLTKFKKDFPAAKIFHLEQNYRSTQKILDFAYSIISKNTTHPVLQLYTKNKGGEEVGFYEAESEEEESLYIALTIEKLKADYEYKQFAVLYRTNAQSRSIEEVFLHRGIPYTLIGGVRFYDRKEVKDILSMLRLLLNPVDRISEERVKKIGKRKWDKFKKYYQENHEEITKKETSLIIEEVLAATEYMSQFDPNVEEDYSRIENVKELKSVAIARPSLLEFLEQVALVESEYSEGEKAKSHQDGVRLMTLHQAKGLEFAVVFLAGVEEGILPHIRSIDDQYSLEEERRLFYVGVTRAESRLHVTWARRRFIYGRRGETRKSRFLEE